MKAEADWLLLFFWPQSDTVVVSEPGSRDLYTADCKPETYEVIVVIELVVSVSIVASSKHCNLRPYQRIGSSESNLDHLAAILL